MISSMVAVIYAAEMPKQAQYKYMHMSKCFAQITICPQKRDDAKIFSFPTFELRSYIIIVIMWLRTLSLVVFYV